MDTLTTTQHSPDLSDLSDAERARFERWFDARFEERMKAREEAHVPTLSIIATKGTLDWAYPPFILASTASAIGYNVNIFFTFYGLLLLQKKLNLEVTPVGNPAMPMRMPMGPEWFQKIDWPIPNIVKTNVPGFERMATSLMKETFRKKGVASIETLREAAIEGGVKFYACQMTVDVFGFEREDFVPDVTDWVGATSFLPMAQKSDITLFV